MTHSRSRSPIPVIGALALGAALAYACGITLERPQKGLPAMVLTQILDDVRSNYVEELSEEQLSDLAHRAFDRMLKELDRHSGFIPPSKVQDFEEDTEGFFVGIGIVLSPPESDQHYPQIAAVIRGGPAERAGITGGDIIQRVEAEDVRGVKIPQLRKKIAGKPNSIVTLHILRGEGENAQTISIARQRVETSSITSVRLYEKDDRPVVGYLRLDQFQLNSAHEVLVAGQNLMEAGAPALIFDMRDNTGGILHQAKELAELFLPEKAVIAATRGRHNRDKPEQIRVENPGPFQTVPLVILMDGGSASASELVAAALHDHGRALLVGEKSFGKWSVQNIIALGIGGVDGRLKLTTKGFYPPASKIRRNAKGHTQGLLPDVEVTTDTGTLRERRSEWHEERLSRVNAPLAVDRLPVPHYDSEDDPKNEDGRRVDAVLIRAIAILSGDGLYETLLAEAKASRAAAETRGTSGSTGAHSVADGDRPEEAVDDPPQSRRP